MMLRFDWDERNRSHIARHGITPEEAEQVISKEPLDLAIEVRDGESRHAHLGETATGRVLVVIAMQIDVTTVRVVTAWPAKKRLRAFWRTQQRGKSYGAEIEGS